MSVIFSGWCSKSICRLLHKFKGQINSKAVVIAAAVRTPDSLPCARNEHQLARLVIDELVKRTGVPRAEFRKLICTSSDKQCIDALNLVAKNLGLNRCETHAIRDEACSVRGLSMSLESLQNHEEDWIILGDTRAHLNQPVVDSSELLTDSYPTRTAQPDEIIGKMPTPLQHPGAAALALTTARTAERLEMQPLALVREFFIENNKTQALYRIGTYDPITIDDVHTWELVYPKGGRENLTMFVNAKSGSVQTHDVKEITASHLLTHTVYSMPTGSVSCVIMETRGGQCLLLILEKLVPEPQSLPLLTLYTREVCPLCDDLVAHLDEEFPNEFKLKKVFIDRKENVRYLRLFRYDIPVLFLNGQFLCMHKLNVQVLRDRLAALKVKGSKAGDDNEK